MDLVTKSESEILDALFNQSRSDYLTKSWTSGGVLTADSRNDIPFTELALAQSLAKFLKDHVVFHKAEGAWYIYNGTEFIKADGDWFIHKIIKEVAAIYNVIMDQIAKTVIPTMKDRQDNEKFDRHFSLNTKLQSASALDTFAKLLKSELDEIPAGMTKEVKFLGLEHLLERVAQVPFVENFIPSVGIGQFYGESYTGKTYAVLDLALSICGGLETWLGKDLNTDGPSQVVYVAAEGGQPFWDAVAGWHQENPSADLSGFQVIDSGAGFNVNITGKEAAPGVFGLEDLKALVKDSGLKPVLVVFDPQANILAGVDENSNSEMIAALTPIQKWANEDGFLALLVHHAGKKDTGMGRGASAQMGMMDLLVKLTKNAAGVRTLSFDKVKGATQPEQQLNFRIKTVAIPTGSRSAGVVVPGELEFTGSEKSFMESSMNKAKIVQYLKDGVTTRSAMVKASSISKEKVQEILDQLRADGRAQNIGSSDTHPKWVLINPED